jgi:hypothetical protein
MKLSGKELRRSSMHVYEIRPHSDERGVDLISDALPFGRLWYGEPDAISKAVGYAKFSAAHMTLSSAFTMKRAT